SAASPPNGQLCSFIAQTRTCGSNGILDGSYASQTCSHPTITISSSANNLNLWNYLVANGFALGGTPGTWNVTIASGVVIGSTSTSTPAFDTGAFPTSSTLSIVNNGDIRGKGGNGGSGAACDSESTNGSPALAGGNGGTALRAQFGLTFTNNGTIWGGGG